VEEPLPGVLVLQEIWGVDAHMEDIAQRFAAAGYVALAPDLFSKGGGRPPALATERVTAVKRFLDKVPPQGWGALMNPEQREKEIAAKLEQIERAPISETLGQLLNPDRMARMGEYIKDTLASLQWLREQPFCRGRRLGAVGFCMGGGLAAGLATEDPGLGAAVSFYGGPPVAEKIPNIQCPILVFVGDEDARLVPQLPAFEQAMKLAGKEMELHMYPKTPHAFFNDTRVSYRVEAARDAWARTLALFARTLAMTA
jgi:carboxymethylenebutenolidase